MSINTGTKKNKNKNNLRNILLKKKRNDKINDQINYIDINCIVTVNMYMGTYLSLSVISFIPASCPTNVPVFKNKPFIK